MKKLIVMIGLLGFIAVVFAVDSSVKVQVKEAELVQLKSQIRDLKTAVNDLKRIAKSLNSKLPSSYNKSSDEDDKLERLRKRQAEIKLKNAIRFDGQEAKHQAEMNALDIREEKENLKQSKDYHRERNRKNW